MFVTSLVSGAAGSASASLPCTYHVGFTNTWVPAGCPVHYYTHRDYDGNDDDSPTGLAVIRDGVAVDVTPNTPGADTTLPVTRNYTSCGESTGHEWESSEPFFKRTFIVENVVPGEVLLPWRYELDNVEQTGIAVIAPGPCFETIPRLTCYGRDYNCPQESGSGENAVGCSTGASSGALAGLASVLLLVSRRRRQRVTGTWPAPRRP